MPTDPNLPTDPAHVDPPAPITPPRKSLIVCQFCECELTPVGDCFRMSERAKGLEKQDRKIEELKQQLADVQAALATAENETREALAEVAKLKEPAKKKSFWED